MYISLLMWFVKRNVGLMDVVSLSSFDLNFIISVIKDITFYVIKVWSWVVGVMYWKYHVLCIYVFTYQ